MSLTCCFFLIPGLVIASIMANETTTTNDTIFSSKDNPFTAEASISTIITNIISNTSMANDITTPSISNTTSNMNISDINTITISPPIMRKRDETTTTSDKASQKPTKSLTTNPIVTRSTSGKTTTNASEPGDITGIIILIVVILVAVGFGVACWFLRKREKSYSVDFTSRQDEANIPLSTVEPELPADTVPQNGMQNESKETTTAEPQHSEQKPEGNEEQKSEVEKSVDPNTESATHVSEDKSKEDTVEQSPLAHVQPSVEEKTDDEGGISNQTSVESLKETNENNSNNTDVSQWRDLESSSIFWDIPLDCPV